MFDVIFISYDEPNADKNYATLLNYCNHAKRIHKIKGIGQAHFQAAKLAATDYFFTVDGDNEVLQSFNWSEVSDLQKNDKRVHVWRCKNPVNGLVYGYGGIKLWSKSYLESLPDFNVDFTTSVAKYGYHIQEKLASITRFNSDPYNSWKGAFRECAKLSSNILNDYSPKTKHRLEVWMNIGLDANYGFECINGARCGTYFGLTANNDELKEINNFDWLTMQFKVNQIPTQDMLNLIKKDFNLEHFSAMHSKMFKEIIFNV